MARRQSLRAGRRIRRSGSVGHDLVPERPPRRVGTLGSLRSSVDRSPRCGARSDLTSSEEKHWQAVRCLDDARNPCLAARSNAGRNPHGLGSTRAVGPVEGPGPGEGSGLGIRRTGPAQDSPGDLPQRRTWVVNQGHQWKRRTDRRLPHGLIANTRSETH